MPDTAAPWPGYASSAIAVKHYELFLVWPVFLQCQRDAAGNASDPKLDPDTAPDFLSLWVDFICNSGTGSWQPLQGSYPPRQGEDAAPAYSEFVYFHPFVRQFLYTTRDDIRAHADKQPGRPKGSYTMDDRDNAVNRNLRILERRDLDSLRVQLERNIAPNKSQPCESFYKVKTAWMYLFDTQIAMVELRLIYDKTQWINTDNSRTPFEGLHLDYVMKMNDIIRRAFAAYWSVDSWSDQSKEPWIGNAAGSCPLEMEWIAIDPKENVISRFGTFKVKKAEEKTDETARAQSAAVNEQLDYVYLHREQYTIPLWRKLLEPVAPTTLEYDAAKPLRFEHILDERVPIFAYLAVDNPRHITPGDWIRLAAIDDDGDSQTYSYSPNFLSPERSKDFFYDRFWDETGEKPAQINIHHTRWCFSGYGFVGVGSADEPGFFTDEHAGVRAHFRHHYFALGLIAHFHRASLLRFKHALAEAADVLHHDEHQTGMQRFRVNVVKLQHDFLRFRTRYWFAEVSNQIQGRELFDLWKKHLNTPALFEGVAGDIEAAEEVLRQFDDERRNSTLLRIAGVGAILTAFSPALGLYQEQLKNASVMGTLAILLFLGGLVGLVFTGSKAAFRRCLDQCLRMVGRLQNVSGWVWSLVLMILGLMLLGLLPKCFPPSPKP